LEDGSGEVKSMRTHPEHLGRGVATRLLDHIIAQAKGRGYSRLSLETGCGPAFAPALALYHKHGFVLGEAFSFYAPSAFSQFLHLQL
jgi:putative acetyltransferase